MDKLRQVHSSLRKEQSWLRSMIAFFKSWEFCSFDSDLQLNPLTKPKRSFGSSWSDQSDITSKEPLNNYIDLHSNIVGNVVNKFNLCDFVNTDSLNHCRHVSQPEPCRTHVRSFVFKHVTSWKRQQSGGKTWLMSSCCLNFSISQAISSWTSKTSLNHSMKDKQAARTCL